MTTNNNLDALFADGELPFGHPGRRCDDTPEGFEPSPLVDQGPERDYTPDEYGRVIHYGPRDRPLCGNDSVTAVYTDDPAAVAGCRDCLELVAEGLDDDNEYMGHCLEVLYDGIRDASIPSGPADIVPTTPERRNGLRAGLGNQPASA